MTFLSFLAFRSPLGNSVARGVSKGAPRNLRRTVARSLPIIPVPPWLNPELECSVGGIDVARSRNVHLARGAKVGGASAKARGRDHSSGRLTVDDRVRAIKMQHQKCVGIALKSRRFCRARYPKKDEHGAIDRRPGKRRSRDGNAGLLRVRIPALRTWIAVVGAACRL